jgi:CubicO group peptidase (beta-lactamase class C family)
MTEKTVSIPELENDIEKVLKLWNVPGAGVGIIKDGKLVSGRGYGVKEAGKTAPVNPSTNFAIGSNTKAFTAACIGMLVEDGKIAWDDKVTHYLPTFALYDPWVTKEVTIRDLLCHRIGISDVERFLYNSTCSNAEVVHRLRYVHPSASFRADFQYSNISFMAAGEILRVVTGQTWEKMVKERIFEPLGMNASTTNFNDVKNLSNAALPHVNPYHGLLSIHARMKDPVQPIAWYDFGSQAAGGITSNVIDMTKWLGMFLGKGSYQGNTILKPETVAAMTRSTSIIQNPALSAVSMAVLNPDIQFWTYGLGWFVVDYKGRKLVFHGGQVQGMISASGFMPQEDLGFVILTNINSSVIQVILCFMILDTFLGDKKRDWSKEYYGVVDLLRKSEEDQIRQLKASRKDDTYPSLPLDGYTGIFDHDYFGEHTVSLEGEELVLQFAPANTGDLEHWQDDTFFIHWRNDPFDNDFLTFSKGDDGKVNGFVIKKEGFFRKL